MFPLVTVLSGIGMYQSYWEAFNFEAEGKVTEAKWNTSNHQMSLFKITNKNTMKQLHHASVTLTPEQIKIGDSFKKVSGSKMCSINGVDIKCVK